MKILGYTIGSAYLWVIFLIALLAGIASYVTSQLPFSIISAVLICSVAEMTLTKYYKKHALKIPISGIITGMIIGAVAPYNAPLLAILIASIVAILSKFFIKSKHGNIFNPAALGLLIGLAIFSLGDSWWISSNINLVGIAITLTPILIIAAYKAKRLTLSVTFIIATIAISSAIGYTNIAALPSGIEATLLSMNYLFAFVMLVDPKTSPHKKIGQMAYGTAIALLYFVVGFSGIQYAFLVSLLIGNLAYAVYRKYQHKLPELFTLRSSSTST